MHLRLLFLSFFKEIFRSTLNGYDFFFLSVIGEYFLYFYAMFIHSHMLCGFCNFVKLVNLGKNQICMMVFVLCLHVYSVFCVKTFVLLHSCMRIFLSVVKSWLTFWGNEKSCKIQLWLCGFLREWEVLQNPIMMVWWTAVLQNFRQFHHITFSCLCISLNHLLSLNG